MDAKPFRSHGQMNKSFVYVGIGLRTKHVAGFRVSRMSAGKQTEEGGNNGCL